MHLRYFKESDLEEIKELFFHTILKVNCQDYTKEQINVWAKRKDMLTVERFTNSITLVAIMDEKIVGYGNVCENGEIDHLYVHHDYQHLGIATRICDELESYHDLEKYVWASITAKPFFENRGYHVERENTVLLENVELTNYLMKK